MAVGNDINSGMPIRSLGDIDKLVKTKMYDSANPNAVGAGRQVTAGGAHSVMFDDQGVAWSRSHPFPVTVEESEGIEVHKHSESATAITQDAVDNQDYTVTALKTFAIEQWGISGSGEMKGELQIETAVASGIFVTVDVLFNSSETPSVDRSYKRNIKVAAGIIVRIVRTNLEDDSQGLYSFVHGLEV